MIRQFFIFLYILLIYSVYAKSQSIDSDFCYEIWKVKTVIAKEKNISDEKYRTLFKSISLELDSNHSVNISHIPLEGLYDIEIISFFELFQNATWIQYYIDDLELFIVINSETGQSLGSFTSKSSSTVLLSFGYKAPREFWNYNLILEK